MILSHSIKPLVNTTLFGFPCPDSADPHNTWTLFDSEQSHKVTPVTLNAQRELMTRICKTNVSASVCPLFEDLFTCCSSDFLPLPHPPASTAHRSIILVQFYVRPRLESIQCPRVIHCQPHFTLSCRRFDQHSSIVWPKN